MIVPKPTEMKMKLQVLLDKNCITLSVCLWGKPIFFVKKNDDTYILCIDYWQSNKMIVKSKYTLPRIDDLIYQVRGAKVISKIDLRLGYHQVRVKDEDIHKIDFITWYGHYEFVVIPVGIANAPPTFMYLMNSIFSKYLENFVLASINDVLVYSKDKEKHENHLRIVLHTLREN